MKRCWCISTSPENWEIYKKNNVWGMDARYYVTIKKFLKEKDQAIVCRQLSRELCLGF